MSTENVKLLRESRCGGSQGRVVYICCPSTAKPASTTTTTTEPPTTSHSPGLRIKFYKLPFLTKFFF